MAMADARPGRHRSPVASYAPAVGALLWRVRNPIRPDLPASSRRELSGRSSERRSLSGCGLIPRRGGKNTPRGARGFPALGADSLAPEPRSEWGVIPI